MSECYQINLYKTLTTLTVKLNKLRMFLHKIISICLSYIAQGKETHNITAEFCKFSLKPILRLVKYAIILEKLF